MLCYRNFIALSCKDPDYSLHGSSCIAVGTSQHDLHFKSRGKSIPARVPAFICSLAVAASAKLLRTVFKQKQKLIEVSQTLQSKEEVLQEVCVPSVSGQ